jgi:DNA-binding beta-propeller fold protein YncE
MKASRFSAACFGLLLGGVAQADMLYVASDPLTGSPYNIYKFDPAANASVFAQQVFLVNSLAFDSHGNLYAAIAQSIGSGGGFVYGNLIEKFDPQGHATVFASAGLGNPYSLAFDRADNLYVANGASNNIMKFDPQGQASIFATTGGTNATMGLAFDSRGTLYGAFGGISQIVKFDALGNQTKFADLSSTYRIAFDRNDQLYATGYGGQDAIYKIDALGEPSLFASGYANDLACDSNNQLYAVVGNEILRYDSNGNASVFATAPPGLDALAFIPEPSVGALLALGLGSWFARWRRAGARW